MDWAQTALQTDFLTGVFWGFYRTPAAQQTIPSVEEEIRRCARHFQLLDSILADRALLLGGRLSLADFPAGTHLYRYFNIDIAPTSWCRSGTRTGGWNIETRGAAAPRSRAAGVTHRCNLFLRGSLRMRRGEPDRDRHLRLSSYMFTAQQYEPIQPNRKLSWGDRMVRAG
jgi:hypothetical protein